MSTKPSGVFVHLENIRVLQHFNLSHVFVHLSLVNEHGHTRLRAHQHHEATKKLEGREADENTKQTL